MIAYLWAIKTGEWVIAHGHQIPIKKIKEKYHELYSVFSVNLDQLRVKLLHQMEFNIKSHPSHQSFSPSSPPQSLYPLLVLQRVGYNHLVL